MGIPAATKALVAFTRSDPTVNDREALEVLKKELFDTSDRVTAVMLGAYVETALEKLLASLMRDDLDSRERNKLFGFEGATGTFSAEDHRPDHLFGPQFNQITTQRIRATMTSAFFPSSKTSSAASPRPVSPASRRTGLMRSFGP